MIRTPPPQRRSLSTSGSPETASGAHTHTERPCTRSRGLALLQGLPLSSRRARSSSASVSHSRENSQVRRNNPVSTVNNSEIVLAISGRMDGDAENNLRQNANGEIPLANEIPLGNQIPRGNDGEDVLLVNLIPLGNQIPRENDGQNALHANQIQPANAGQNIPLANQIPPENAAQNFQQAPLGNNLRNVMPAYDFRNPALVQNPPPPGFIDNHARFAQPNMDDWRHLLHALVRNNLQLPEFAGQDHEDPENFLRECDTSFRATNTEMHMRARLASRALKDDAARWFAVYKNLNLTWEKFCELIRNRFASPTHLMKLSAKLYGQPQTDKEGTSLFLEQRHLLARRIFPDAPEQQIVGLLIETLRPATKKLLRTSVFETVGDLVIRAQQIEQDEIEERNAVRRYAQNTTPLAAAQSRAATPTSALPTQPPEPRSNAPNLPKCHHCPGRHWNRDCPRNPLRQGQGNGSGAPMNVVNAAPGSTTQ